MALPRWYMVVTDLLLKWRVILRYSSYGRFRSSSKLMQFIELHGV